MKRILLIISSIAILAACSNPKDGDYTIHVLSTNDVHGSFFDDSYAGGTPRRSLFGIKHLADSVRATFGKENVIMIDAGDCLQGDNATYYFNYVDTLSTHVYPRLVEYMGYDAITVGNHDVETGHPVYDRVAKDLHKAGIPFLAGNAIKGSDGKAYFDTYKTYKRGGMKVLVLGYSNANIKAWLNEDLWYGMEFKSLLPLVQEDVNRIVAKEKPQVVIVSVHSGTGEGDGTVLESQGMDLFKSLYGVDVLLCSHDHRPFVKNSGDMILINTGSRAQNLGHGTVSVKVRKHKVVAKDYDVELIANNTTNIDQDMKAAFKPDFEAVKAFTSKEVGQLATDLKTRDSYKGACDYINLIHTVCLGCTPAQISFAAPLTYDKEIKAGTLIFNDMFTIYPYENQLFVVKMTGEQVKNFLEYSYNMWIQTAQSPADHVLNIREGDDPRTGQKSYSFKGASYNFDSATGINYTVDVTKPYGERIAISSLADGTSFSYGESYNVAMTSYRASGGGGSMTEGAGIDTEHIDDIVVRKYPEIRNLIYDYIVEHGTIDSQLISNPEKLGTWCFVPEKIAEPAIKRDFELLFK